MNINHKFRKLLGHRQAGVVYLWMMLDIIINITPDIAAGLNIHIKLFGENGLKGLYPKGVHFDSLVLNYGSICHSLDHQGSLLEDAITTVLKVLSMASHADFAKLFKEFEITLKNPMLNVNLKGTMMDQIVEVMDTALTQYTL